jgi:hypothetical protein
MEKQCDAYSDAELKFLVRYGNESYQSMLEATTQLNSANEAAKPKKPDRSAKTRRAP